MELLGRRDQPRLLVIGVPEDSELGRHLSELVPTILFVRDAAELGLLRQGEWDAAVIQGSGPYLEAHLFVLQFGGEACGMTTIPGADLRIERSRSSVSQEVCIPDGLPDEVRRLVRSELAPIVMEQRSVNTLWVLPVRYTTGSPPDREEVSAVLQPFLLDPDGEVFAGRYVRANTTAEWWVLPHFTPNPERWATAALESWRKLDESRFPSAAAWQRRPEWQTAAERSVTDERVRLEEAWTQARAAFEREMSVLQVRENEAIQAGDEGIRRLLTAQGEDLVDEVIEALSSLGFDVVDVDKEVSTPGDRREDLRVSEGSEWVALAEVRGYGKGAQLSDLLRLGRFVTRYLRDEHREPDAVWYIVNSFRQTDPSTRPRPLESNREEVETFAESGGVVISTVDLFRLRMQVESGETSNSEVRRVLRDARGVLTLK